jgi:copper oxidase (laccase) domain-containing protein
VGRAGAFKNIIKKSVTKMTELFTCKIDSLYVSIGPSIHGCCYEIDKTIADEAKELGYADMLSFRDEKIFLHVNDIIKSQLKDLGIEKTEEIAICTSCENKSFFSYREDKKVTGRNSAVVMLTDNHKL